MLQGLLKKYRKYKIVGAPCGCPVFIATKRAGTRHSPYNMGFFNKPFSVVLYKLLG